MTSIYRLSQNQESRRNRATLLVPRLRPGMHDWRLRLHYRTECQTVTGQNPEDMGSQRSLMCAKFKCEI